MSKEELQEVKADGEDSSTMDPVTPAGGDPKGKNRKADKRTSVDPKADNIEDQEKTPQGTAASKESPVKGKTTAKQAPKRLADKRGMGEMVEKMFDGQDLSEEFKEQATVVFEAAVNERISEELEAMNEEFEQKLEEQTTSAIEELVEQVDTYLDYVVEKWMEENEVGIENAIRTDIAESFMDGLRDLFKEHNLDIPESEADTVAEMLEAMEELESKLNEAVDRNIELQHQLDEALEEDAFEEIAEGLSANQADKLRSLVEGISYENMDDYKRKAEIIKENYFGSSDTLTEEASDDVEPIAEEDHSFDNVDPEVARIAESISKFKQRY